MDTERYAKQLAKAAGPVTSLRPPARRAGLWLVLSAIWVAGITWLLGPEIDSEAGSLAFVAFAAALATAVLAANAAFQSVVPGSQRLWAWLPIVTAAAWFAVLAIGSLRDPAGASSAFHFDADCLVPMVLAGLVPTLVIVAMLRRGAPLQPRATLSLAGLAAGALANAALHLVHGGDGYLMALVWHFTAVAAFSLAAAAIAPRFLNWHLVRA